ncbi:monocarboxylate transporter 2-like [Ptychodera flava]|uniref:monocarboxylate transporter 2-like n=1 Tax=Ptychodera flava TaxID=63121 RepID=UPI00396A3824
MPESTRQESRRLNTVFKTSDYTPGVVYVYTHNPFRFGYALIVGPSLGIVALCIKRRYVLANSLVMVGSSTGGILLAPMFQFLINKYGWRDTLFIFAGMNLQTCICALFFKAPESPGNVSGVTGESSHQSEHDSDNKEEPRKLQAVVERLDLDLFIKHKQFTVFAIAILLGIGMGLFGSTPHWYADDLQLAPLQELSFLVSIFGICGIIGRLLPNLMRRRNSINAFGFIFILTGVTNIVSAFVEIYSLYAVYVGVLGVLNGVIATLMTQVPRDIVGPQKITAAIGLSNPFMAMGAFIGPITAGCIYDQTGDYDDAFYFYSACSLAAGLLVVVTDPFIKPLYRRPSLQDLETGSLSERKSPLRSDGTLQSSEYGSQEHNSKDTQT